MSPAASDDLPQFKADWIEEALEAKALIFGDFTLKSGRCVLVRLCLARPSPPRRHAEQERLELSRVALLPRLLPN
jgi:hypothetical protein